MLGYHAFSQEAIEVSSIIGFMTASHSQIVVMTTFHRAVYVLRTVRSLLPKYLDKLDEPNK